MDKPDHKHTRRIFIHPHTGDKQAKQVLQTILTNAGLGMSKSNKLATDNVRQAKLPRCSDEAMYCQYNTRPLRSESLYQHTRNEWDLLTVQPQPKSKPRHGLIRRKGKSQQAILICWKPADGSKITLYHDSSWDFRYPKCSTWCTSNYWFLASDRPKEKHMYVSVSCLNGGKSWVTSYHHSVRAWKYQHPPKPTILEVFETLS